MQEDRLTIRWATEGDVESLAILMTELGYATTGEEMRDRLRVINGEPHYKVFVADYNGIVAGMAGALKSYYFEQNGSYVRLGALVTKEAYRNRGVGKALVEAVEQWAKEVQAHAIVLNCGNREERKVAHGFYRQVGFEARSTGYVKQLF